MEDLRSKIYLKYNVRRWNMGDIYAISSILFEISTKGGIGILSDTSDILMMVFEGRRNM